MARKRAEVDGPTTAHGLLTLCCALRAFVADARRSVPRRTCDRRVRGQVPAQVPGQVPGNSRRQHALDASRRRNPTSTHAQESSRGRRRFPPQTCISWRCALQSSVVTKDNAPFQKDGGTHAQRRQQWQVHGEPDALAADRGCCRAASGRDGHVSRICSPEGMVTGVMAAAARRAAVCAGAAHGCRVDADRVVGGARLPGLGRAPDIGACCRAEACRPGRSWHAVGSHGAPRSAPAPKVLSSFVPVRGEPTAVGLAVGCAGRAGSAAAAVRAAAPLAAGYRASVHAHGRERARTRRHARARRPDHGARDVHPRRRWRNDPRARARRPLGARGRPGPEHR